MQISSVHLHKDKKSTRLSRKTESLVLLCFYKKTVQNANAEGSLRNAAPF